MQQQPTQINEYSYDNEEFQCPPDDSQASKVDKLFTINYEQSNYQSIQLSTNEMRLMMKELSKKLDEKIHKYYGLMGQRHVKQEDDVETYKEKLRKQVETHNKLIEAQLTEIKEIQQLDVEMASSKRVQKQAERLRDYFDTKKAMVQADKQARFSKGEMNKAGEYLARDLDSQKHYFRLNKIKEEFEYAMLKERNLTKKTDELEQKYKEMQQKHQKMNQVYSQRVSEAESNKILVHDNRQFFAEYQTKKQYLLFKDELKKKTQILKYNIQNTLIKITADIQKMKLTQKQHTDKTALCESQIQSLSKDIYQSAGTPQINQKIQLNLSIKNINVLLKTKRLKNDQMIKNSSQLFQKSPQFKPTLDMTESSILLKPNFKIKHYLTKSKSKMGSVQISAIHKSMDFGKKQSKDKDLRGFLQSISQKGGGPNDKRLLKWQPRKKSAASKRLLPMSAGKGHGKSNPEEYIQEE